MTDVMPAQLAATLETLLMVAVSVSFCVFFGLTLGCWLPVSSPQGMAPSRAVHQALAAFANISRSVPFLLLIVLLLPFTRLLVGTSIGTAAAIIPLVIGGTPYAARLVESALLDGDSGLIQAFPMLAITMINFSGMAGAVGGGGLAIHYGYQRFRLDILLLCCVILILLVQVIQFGGNTLARRFDRR